MSEQQHPNEETLTGNAEAEVLDAAEAAPL